MTPTNATPEPVATAVVHLARTRYAGANHTHLSELLSERDSIDIGRTTLRRILVNAGLSSPRRRRPPKHRVRRQCMPRKGMLIQMDGGYHPRRTDISYPSGILARTGHSQPPADRCPGVVAPFNRDSGTLQGKRTVWGGRARVRTSLYTGAMVASRFNPIIRTSTSVCCLLASRKSWL